MSMRVEHELHHRRRGRNWGVGLLLVAFVALIFGLTVVKTLSLGSIVELERFDHVARPQLVPQGGEAGQ
ncbi:hypothetical protein [Limimaricola cinnabarinus]|jgi:hypothetical protein|uniref:Cytochrome C oxidase assembly protein n=1 Tax=Limimaricola cinnabarinus TaxID=1125964 RepID=A0A2G1ML36_9RHOB|nr:hypothetical protein [Limimaricola cinnabarinus]PHP29468.1 hypothetical protein CJ301_03120 [Limimaricola cinnabarinus]